MALAASDPPPLQSPSFSHPPLLPPSPPRLVPHLPILEAEVAYCMDHEYCQTVQDFLERRTRIAFLDSAAAEAAAPRVGALMGERLGWSSERQREEVDRAVESIRWNFTTQQAPPPLPSNSASA